MDRTLRITVAGEPATVSLPAPLVDRAGAVAEVTLAFGAHRAAAALRTHAAAPDAVQVSPDLAEHLHLPPECPCQVRVGSRGVRLGPVVGILAARRHEQMQPDRLRSLADHLVNYADHGGLIYAFARAAVSLEAGTVEGYRYVGGDGQEWAPGIFPLPQVIFRRFGVPLGAGVAALRARGVQVFNERIFDKWEAARWLAADPQLRPYLPETELLGDADTVLAMLARHPSVYVKPIWGAKGARIVRVRRAEAGFSLDQAGQGPLPCADEEALRAALGPRLPRPGIVQQGLELAAAGGRLVDFRVILLRGGAGRWTVPGIVARCGAAGLFLSNMATGGFPLPAEAALALLFGPGEAVAFRRKQELAELGLTAGAALDRSGLLLGDLGLDVAYDRHDHPWIIEANNRYPDHAIAWEAGDWPLFYRARALPMAYACFLSGFGDAQGGTGP